MNPEPFVKRVELILEGFIFKFVVVLDKKVSGPDWPKNEGSHHDTIADLEERVCISYKTEKEDG